MAYFEKDFLSFFKELEKNNSKAWFDENRKRYENSVKIPFANFIGEMIKRMQAHDADLKIEPKDCILRINRDIRFSKDKTPYNTHVTAFISSGGRKDKTKPGFFIRLTPKEVGVMIGCFHPDKNQLQNIRETIASDTKAFSKIINENKFKNKFGELKGEEHKRIPAEFKEVAEKEPLIVRKQFYATAMLDGKLLLQDDLAEILMEYYHAARPFNIYMTRALQS